MNLPVHSLKTRITLVTLAIFVLSIWSLALFTGRLLREDIQQLLGKQQLSIAEIVAEEINQELLDRFHALTKIALAIGPGHFRHPTTLDPVLSANILFTEMFNGGAFVTRSDGTAIASIPASAGRVGINYMDRDHIIAALQQGQPAISEPVAGKMLKSPVVSMAVPILDGQLKVVGALVGVTDLGRDNFFDKIIQHRYGHTGGYLLVDPKHARIVTATDKRLVLVPLSEHSVGPLQAQYTNGFVGYGIEVNASGVENLTSAQSIPAAGWYLEALLPTEEAFAPIHALRLRMFYAAALLTALAGGLTWWTLRRELAPLLTTATQLAALPAGKNFPLALKVTRQDEIGQLIGGFNRLLETLRQREAALLDNEKQLRQLSRITEQAQIAIVITDLQGVIEYVNPKFVEVTGFGADEVVGRNPRILQSGKTPADTYSSLWNTLSSGGIWHGEFLNRKKNGEVFVEQAVIAPVLDPQGIATHYVAIKQDITVLKESQLEQERLLGEKTALLNEVHHRVKNNLQVITSLLRLEEGRTLQVDTKTVLRDMQGRIRSMALIHETLYRSGNFAEVNLHSHLGQVASVAFRAQVATVVPVRLVLDLAPARTSMDQATPCGLLVNELISNSLKHGFTAGQGGEVRVQLQPAPAAPDSAGNPAPWCLRVRDTGIGLPADFDVRRSQSLGLRLVSDLARQLGGTLHVEPGPGAAFSVTFPIKGHREI